MLLLFLVNRAGCMYTLCRAIADIETDAFVPVNIETRLITAVDRLALDRCPIDDAWSARHLRYWRDLWTILSSESHPRWSMTQSCGLLDQTELEIVAEARACPVDANDLARAGADTPIRTT